MKSSVILLLAVLASTAACAGSATRQDVPRPTLVTPLGLEPPPIYALLGFRDKIELNSAQINALDSIAIYTHDQNEPLIRTLRDSSSAPRNRAGMIVAGEQQSILGKIRTNNKQAATSVAELLTPEQEEAVCTVFEDARQERMDRLHDAVGNRNRNRRRGEVSGEAADSILALGLNVWPWCGQGSGNSD